MSLQGSNLHLHVLNLSKLRHASPPFELLSSGFVSAERLLLSVIFLLLSSDFRLFVPDLLVQQLYGRLFLFDPMFLFLAFIRVKDNHFLAFNELTDVLFGYYRVQSERGEVVVVLVFCLD